MTSNSPNLRLAFAGSGWINKVHARAAQQIPGVELAAVINHRPESRLAFATEFAIHRQFETIEELIAAEAADAVIVSTPNFLHAPQTIAALNAGLHVLVEKPMAMNAAEARQMLAASQSAGRVLMVAHNWRFDPEVLWLKEQVAAGAVGKVIRTKGYSVHVNWGPGGWFTNKRLAGGGAMADMGIHALDTTRFVLGDPQPATVYAQIGTYYKDFDVDDTGVILVTWEDGVLSYLESGWWQPHVDAPQSSTHVYGTAGYAQIFPTYIETSAERRETSFPYPRERHAPQSLYDRQMAHFIDCVRGKAQPVPSGAQGLANMLVVDAAYESARTGQAVKISELG